jgi:hypothetical protein
MQAQELVLRDVHVPASPSSWPPAPGWWLLAAAGLLLFTVVLWMRRRRLHRLRAWQAMYDDASSKVSPAAQIAAISELLRRAARRVDARADKLQGDEWLRFLDGEKRKGFSGGAGRLLLEGGYRREVDATELAATLELAQARFLELMAKRK